MRYCDTWYFSVLSFAVCEKDFFSFFLLDEAWKTIQIYLSRTQRPTIKHLWPLAENQGAYCFWSVCLSARLTGQLSPNIILACNFWYRQGTVFIIRTSHSLGQTFSDGIILYLNLYPVTLDDPAVGMVLHSDILFLTRFLTGSLDTEIVFFI